MSFDISVSVPKEKIINALELFLSDIKYHTDNLTTQVTFSSVGTKKSFFGKPASMREAIATSTEFLSYYTNYPALKQQTEVKLRLLKVLGDDIKTVNVPLEFLETLRIYDVTLSPRTADQKV